MSDTSNTEDSPVRACGIAPLYHKGLDVPVEGGAVIVATGAQCQEIVGSFGHLQHEGKCVATDKARERRIISLIMLFSWRSYINAAYIETFVSLVLHFAQPRNIESRAEDDMHLG